MADSQRTDLIRIPAGQKIPVSLSGTKCAVESASFPFGLQLGQRNMNTAKPGLKLRAEEGFTQIIIQNPNAARDLYVILWCGTADVDFNFNEEPPKKSLGWTGITIANNGNAIFPGQASQAADYVTAGIPAGARRKYLTVSLRPSLGGKVFVVNNATDGLLAIVAASSSGGGFPIETDDDVKIINYTGGSVGTDGSGADISIAETFYL